MKELVIPPPARRDPKSVEMVRAWIAEQGLHCTVNIGLWGDNEQDEASSWGILLSDVIRHVSNAVEEQYGQPAPAAVRAIIRAMAKELKLPTSEANGYFWSN